MPDQNICREQVLLWSAAGGVGGGERGRSLMMVVLRGGEGDGGSGGQGLVVLWKLFTAAESKRKEHESGFALFLSI